MDESTPPDDFPVFTSTETAAITLHETLTTLIEAGWPERRAIIYIIEMGLAYQREKKAQGEQEA